MIASDLSEIKRACPSPNSPGIDHDLLKSLWSEPVKLYRLSNLLRQKSAKDEVSFVINRNINFTNQCTGSCKFCSFKHGRRFRLSTEEILSRADQAEERGATEICLQGGLSPSMHLEDYCNILETIRCSHPRLHLHAYSPMEVLHMSRNSNMPLADCLKELKRSGLGSMPGTAAEILVDSVRQMICPEKLNTVEWKEIITNAHQLGIPTTSTILFGHVESMEDRLKHLEVLKGIQNETRGFTEFVLLPFIPENNLLGRTVPGVHLLDRLKMHALARVALYPAITNIQASWTKLGREAARAAIMWGANDLGGTLMDERIARNSREDPGISAEEIKELIESCGRKAVQRTTLYQRV